MDEDCGNGNELKNTVRNLEESLEKDREESGRPFELGSMSPEQVIQEKQSIQRALNQFKVSFPIDLQKHQSIGGYDLERSDHDLIKDHILVKLKIMI